MTALAEFTAALHHGPGPHASGSPQTVHGGGPAATKPDYSSPNVKWRAWLDSVLIGASPKEMPGVVKGIAKFLKEKYNGATFADLREMYTYDDPESGLRAEIDTVQAIGTNGSQTWVSGLTVSGNVIDRAGDGEIIGHFERNIDDRGHVEHEKFVLQERFRNQGFGGRFYQHSEQVYRRIGVKLVHLQANMSVGGYAWARMGFDFAPGFDGKMGKRYLKSYANFARVLWDEETHGGAPFPAAQLEHAWDIAALTTPSGRRVGKEALLGQSWYAQKRLAPDAEGVRVGDLYYAAKAKKEPK
jgi:GNAT superfamily N-acetyltransferase